MSIWSKLAETTKLKLRDPKSFIEYAPIIAKKFCSVAPRSETVKFVRLSSQNCSEMLVLTGQTHTFLNKNKMSS